jgi:hypothetical protein
MLGGKTGGAEITGCGAVGVVAGATVFAGGWAGSVSMSIKGFTPHAFTIDDKICFTQ